MRFFLPISLFILLLTFFIPVTSQAEVIVSTYVGHDGSPTYSIGLDNSIDGSPIYYTSPPAKIDMVLVWNENEQDFLETVPSPRGENVFMYSDKGITRYVDGRSGKILTEADLLSLQDPNNFELPRPVPGSKDDPVSPTLDGYIDGVDGPLYVPGQIPTDPRLNLRASSLPAAPPPDPHRSETELYGMTQNGKATQLMPGVDFDAASFPGFSDITAFETPEGTRFFGEDANGNRVELDPGTGKPLEKTEEETVKCEGGDGTTPPGEDESCKCTKGGEKQKNGSCKCKEGERRNSDGQCEEIQCGPDDVNVNDRGYMGTTLIELKAKAEKFLVVMEGDKQCICETWNLTNYRDDVAGLPYVPTFCPKDSDSTAEPSVTGVTPPGVTAPATSFPGGGALSGGLGDLGSMLGTGSMGGLMQALGPLIGMLGQAMMNNQGGGSNGQPLPQDDFPVDQSCLDELRTLQGQLESGSDADAPSDRCMGQLRTLLSDDEIDVVNEVFDDEGNNNNGGDDNNGDENKKDGVEATACVETEAYNTDCTPKKVTQKNGKVTFGEGDESTTYKKRGDKDIFVDTETGEKFTWEEVLDREAVSEKDDGLFNTLFGDEEDNSALINLIDDIFESKAGSVIASIFNSTNLANTYDRASGAVTNSFAAVGDSISSFMGRNRTENRQETTRVDNVRTSNSFNAQ